jgi:hypothetical protein
LYNNSTGNLNTAVGYGSLICNTSGSTNTAIGGNSLRCNISGSCNVAIGYATLYNNTVSNQVAVGHCVLQSNTTGVKNTALGFESLKLNTTGIKNTALGYKSLTANTTGNSNIAIGYKTLDGTSPYTPSSANVAIGNTALPAGLYSVAIGNYALKCSKAVSQYYSGYGYYTVLPRGNVAVGNYSLQNTVTTFGWSTGPYSLGGNFNTAIGYRSLVSNTTGQYNTAVGVSAGTNITTQSNIIAVGKDASTSATTGHTVWGTSANNVCNCVYAAWSTVSDCNDKTNINNLSDKLGLNFIMKLRPVSFNWDHRDTYVRECGYEYGTKDGTLVGNKEHYGLIAQDLKSTINELNVNFDGLGYDEEKDAYRVTYEELIAPIIKSIQEQQKQIEELKLLIKK